MTEERIVRCWHFWRRRSGKPPWRPMECVTCSLINAAWRAKLIELRKADEE